MEATCSQHNHKYLRICHKSHKEGVPSLVNFILLWLIFLIIYEESTFSSVSLFFPEQGDYREKGKDKQTEKETEETESPAKNLLLIHRKNLDFTEQLWDILKGMTRVIIWNIFKLNPNSIE